MASIKPGVIHVALEDGYFVGQLLNHRIAVGQNPILALDAIKQFRREGEELVGRELIEVGSLSHGRQYAKLQTSSRFPYLVMVLLAGLWLQHRDHPR